MSLLGVSMKAAVVLSVSSVRKVHAQAVPHPAESCRDEIKHFRIVATDNPLKTWDEAKSDCEASEWMGRQGGLATVRSAVQQTLIERIGWTDCDAHIGGRRFSSSDPAGPQDRWQWVGDDEVFWDSGAVASFNHFYRTNGVEMPRPSSEANGYLSILRGTVKDTSSAADMYRWGNTLATDHRAYICEYCLAEGQLPSAGGVVRIAGLNTDLHCDRRGRVLILRQTAHDRDILVHGSCRAEYGEMPLDGCGWIDEPSVRLIAARATKVTMDHYPYGEVSSATDDPVEALRTGRQWYGTDPNEFYELNYTQWDADLNGWCFRQNSWPSYRGNSWKWPTMYYSHGISCAHLWDAWNGARYVSSPRWNYRMETWLTMEEGVCPCLSGQYVNNAGTGCVLPCTAGFKPDANQVECVSCAIDNADTYGNVSAAEPDSCGVVTCAAGFKPDANEVECVSCAVTNADTYGNVSAAEPDSCGVLTCAAGFEVDDANTSCVSETLVTPTDPNSYTSPEPSLNVDSDPNPTPNPTPDANPITNVDPNPTDPVTRDVGKADAEAEGVNPVWFAALALPVLVLVGVGVFCAMKHRGSGSRSAKGAKDEPDAADITNNLELKEVGLLQVHDDATAEVGALPESEANPEICVGASEGGHGQKIIEYETNPLLDGNQAVQPSEDQAVQPPEGEALQPPEGEAVQPNEAEL